jgi:L,D-transpeptidase catalytic domain
MLLGLAVTAGRGESPGIPLQLAAVPKALDQVACSWRPEQIDLLEKLNRQDRKSLFKSGRIVEPEYWTADERDYAPLPSTLAWARELDQLIVVHKPLQVFAAYVHGELVRWGPVSTGVEKSPTPSGLFALNWRAKFHRSTVNRSWMLPWYFNFDNESGRAFHQYELPGLPASHGCVRMLQRDAQWLYDWGREWTLDARGWTVTESGTPVLIIGEYPQVETPPWRDAELLASGFALSRQGLWLENAAASLLGDRPKELAAASEVAAQAPPGASLE